MVKFTAALRIGIHHQCRRYFSFHAIGRTVLYRQLIGSFGLAGIGIGAAAINIDCFLTAQFHHGLCSLFISPSNGFRCLSSICTKENYFSVFLYTNRISRHSAFICTEPIRQVHFAICDQLIRSANCFFDVAQVSRSVHITNYRFARFSVFPLQYCKIIVTFTPATGVLYHFSVHDKDTDRLSGGHIKVISIRRRYDILSGLFGHCGRLISNGLQSPLSTGIVILIAGKDSGFFCEIHSRSISLYLIIPLGVYQCDMLFFYSRCNAVLLQRSQQFPFRSGKIRSENAFHIAESQKKYTA